MHYKIKNYSVSSGFSDIRSINIVERNFPSIIDKLPTLVFPNRTLPGLNEIITFYENDLHVTDLITKSKNFVDKNPNYRITDISTHKKIK